MRVDMVNPQAQLEREIADPRMKRDDVALTYAFAIRQHAARTDSVDFPKVNRLIIDRWSVAALVYIKEQAWKRVRETPANSPNTPDENMPTRGSSKA